MYARKDAYTGLMDKEEGESLQPSRRLRVKDRFNTCLRAMQI